jgi:hypothetical protein
MGQEIETCNFSKHDFSAFSRGLNQETQLIADYFHNKQFSNEGYIGGFEIEALLVNRTGTPEPINSEFLKQLNNPLVVHELAAFNVEINSVPVSLNQHALKNLESNLHATWDACTAVAEELSIDLMMIGISPSIQEAQLSLANMSPLNRYKALNDQMFKLRNGKPITLDISGKETIKTTHNNVMLESACTSLQLHLQTPVDMAAQFYNASMIISAPIVAATANSPYLFGHELWDETRIPLFEQSVELGTKDYRRVTFGSAYIKHSLLECFEENIKHYPVLLPLKESNNGDAFSHLKFHNGTIWRWNRPLIDFDSNHKPHIRIEHRTIPSGPSIVDSIANAALYFGLVYELVHSLDNYETQLPFTLAKDNFYACAKHGLDATINWPNHGNVSVRYLLIETLIPAARRGLEKLSIANDDIDKYLTIIKTRIENRQNGANWQRKWVKKHGRDMLRLTCAYLERQNSGLPVHEWSI